MSIEFKPAKREAVGLLIGLSGPSGSGKTFSAMRLASGIAGNKRFAVIDTEAGRAKHYADQFAFDHADLTAPFTPDRYREAIEAADKAGYPVIVVDSASHEWAGDGGILDMHDAEFQRMGGREAVKMAAWIKPKGQHKKMVTKLLQVRAHLILCFRAEEKVEMVKDDKGKMQIVPKSGLTGLDGWMPICEKSLPFEMTASFLLLPNHPGVPHPIKLQEQHKELFPPGKPIDEQAGKRIAQWAAGGEMPASGGDKPNDAPPDSPSPERDVKSSVDELIGQYNMCNEPDVFEMLEEVRASLWKRCGAPAKAKLKEASTKAKRRADEYAAGNA